jgi:hypothetical protein
VGELDTVVGGAVDVIESFSDGGVSVGDAGTSVAVFVGSKRVGVEDVIGSSSRTWKTWLVDLGFCVIVVCEVSTGVIWLQAVNKNKKKNERMINVFNREIFMHCAPANGN